MISRPKPLTDCRQTSQQSQGRLCPGNGGLCLGVTAQGRCLKQVVVHLRKLLDPEDKTEIGKPTCSSLEVKPLSIGCGYPKTDRS